jgi:hypothetical protein
LVASQEVGERMRRFVAPSAYAATLENPLFNEAVTGKIEELYAEVLAAP